jgi:hypothetical protein
LSMSSAAMDSATSCHVVPRRSCVVIPMVRGLRRTSAHPVGGSTLVSRLWRGIDGYQNPTLLPGYRRGRRQCRVETVRRV